VRVTRALLAQASAALSSLVELSRPADEALSLFFRGHRSLGQHDRAFIAETAFAALRRRRSLEAAAGSGAPEALLAAALLRIIGLSGRALEGLVEEKLVARIRAARAESFPEAVRADLPDWLWDRLVAGHGDAEAMRIAQGMLNAAPLDLRVNVARVTRDAVLARLGEDEIAASTTPYSPAGIRLSGKPPVNRHPLFRDGLIEVQDEGSQLLAWLLAPRRGERLAALAPRAARASVSNVHAIVLSGEIDTRAKRLAGKLDRVLVDAPCSGFGTLRRNPDLKWRHGPEAVAELAQKQHRILAAAARLVKPGGRLVYATCSILPDENEAVADAFCSAHAEFTPLPCNELLAAQRIPLDTGERLRLWPHIHGTDGFFAAAFQRR